MDPYQTQALAWSIWATPALFAYDIILTFGDEIRYVWQGRWTLPKTLYVTARYVGFGTTIVGAIASTQDRTDTFCDPFNAVFMILFSAISSSSDGLLLMRVCALCGPTARLPQARIGILQLFLIAAYSALVLYELTLIVWVFIASVNYTPDADNWGCFQVTGLPGWAFSSVLISTLSFNALLFLCTVVRLLPPWLRGEAGPLLTLLTRDGLFYFAQMFATSMASVIMMIGINRPDIQSAAAPWYTVLTPIAICRLFLNVKSMRHSETDYIDYSSEDETDFSFRSKGAAARRVVTREPLSTLATISEDSDGPGRHYDQERSGSSDSTGWSEPWTC